MKRKTLIKIMIIILFLTLITSGNVKAVYQSTPQTYANPQSQTWDAWLIGIRTMETTGGAMGLEETLNGTEATSTSNNIDVHMAKATEYGAVALLSASPYGNPNNTQKPETSTGDTKAQGANGAFYNYDNWEFTACIHQDDVGSSFSRYWDKYNTLSLRGLSPSQTWHGGSAGSAYDSRGVYDPNYTEQNARVTEYYVDIRSGTRKGGVKSVLSVGANGLFSYNWASKVEGWTLGYQVTTYGYYLYDNWNSRPSLWGTNITKDSCYARGAAVNMEGI